MPEARHAFQTLPLGRHPVTRFLYDDAVDRQAGTPATNGKPLGWDGPLTAADVGSIAQQLDNSSFWFLSSVTPTTWIALAATSTGGGASQGSIDGLVPEWTTTTTLTVSVGQARSDDDLSDLELVAPVVVDIALSGAGGLDTGAPATNEWYASWAIGDSGLVNPTTAILSLSGTSPTLPGGYDRKRILGWHRRQASIWLRWDVFGVGRNRVFWYDAARTSPPQRVVSGGSATGWATADASDILPPVVGQSQWLAQILVTGVGAWVRPNGHLDASGLQFIRPQNTDQFELRVADQQIQYQNDGPGGSLTLDCQAFEVVV
jgi:hypothetical protein